MKTLHVFPLPPGEDERRDIAVLENIGKRFDLGRLRYYDKLSEGKYTFLYARFEKGKVVVKHDENVGLALVKARKMKVKRKK
ncbi:hypothetical protein L3N51_00606 [Metallosphaera sp. J1]|uniref:hypothetical protein n=1 Tax=Metallosphaera TaxID=41980 RepID=UPI001EE09952|nr:hypothetical protein [Metallosphaera javensis (ex Hofmann et al. 2022)]MCG3108325.1 hypothetical protein [Metallosphaera javensis (ex Hofmann et al. 2022)]BCS92712.1 MAG: hypothetical protein MjAS7_1320 [Metallosphaera javensis (ex Sakai et al. 2022)]